MKRDKDCKGCSWNFGDGFPCLYCKDHDLYIEFPYHPSEDTAIQKMVTEIMSAVIFVLIGYALGLSINELKELKTDAKLQQEDNPTDGL